MKDVFQLMRLDRKTAYKRGLYGVEIEVEGKQLPVPTKYWDAVADGSLRGHSVEYVMSTPRSLSGVKLAVKSLSHLIRTTGGSINDSHRTGVHVHVNVQRLTAKQLFTFITAYLVLEDLMVDWCGKSRVGNLFCLRTRDAEGFYDYVRKALKSRDLRLLGTDDIRYCSINLASLSKYGSVEFRSMRTPTDLDKVLVWVNMLDRLYNNSVNLFNDPRTVIEAMSLHQPKGFVEMVMGDMAGELSNAQGLEQKVWEGVRRAQDVAYGHDWEKELGRAVEPEPKIRGLNFNIPEGVVIDEVAAQPAQDWNEEW